MHELSIAQSIVELAEDVAMKEKANSIKSIDIEIGALSGVVLDALDFAMEMTIKSTKLENAEINYLKKIGIASCKGCKIQFETEDLLALCPKCNQANYKIIDGKQLKIRSLTI